MDIQEAFVTLNRRFAETVNSHDTPQWVALFAEDAILIPADHEVVTGRKGIEEWAEVASKVWNHLEIQPGFCTSEGSVAWESGTWAGNINVEEGRTMDITGNFLLLARIEESALRIKAHTWNVKTATP